MTGIRRRGVTPCYLRPYGFISIRTCGGGPSARTVTLAVPSSRELPAGAESGAAVLGLVGLGDHRILAGRERLGLELAVYGADVRIEHGELPLVGLARVAAGLAVLDEDERAGHAGILQPRQLADDRLAGLAHKLDFGGLAGLQGHVAAVEEHALPRSPTRSSLVRARS